MTAAVSIVVPVKDGARYLHELLAAVRRETTQAEVLVIDSGSSDGSREIARAAGAEVLEIAPQEYGHGRTRNLGAERASGDVICFLTQDATPQPGWLEAHLEAFALDPQVGATFGPHLPRPDTSPMIARELTEFFAGFSANGGPAVRDPADPPFLSNVNACYRRECWQQLRFSDLPYAEDQAFARAMSDTGWLVAYHPAAAVLHAHDYSPLGFMRRYFDEYRGLRDTAGHIEPLGLRSTVRDVRGLVAADLRWMRERDWPPRRRASWTARSALHHGSRKVFSALGSRAPSLPGLLQQAISLERAAPAGLEPPGARPPGPPSPYEAIAEISRAGPTPLLDPVPGMSRAARLHIAVVIPTFNRGSGGHATIYNLLTRLEERGHTITTWLYDPHEYLQYAWRAVVRSQLREYFRPTRGPVFKGFDDWYGADVVLATGWDTVYPVLRLDHCRARAYLVQDHEPEFFATSAESLWAHETYRAGLYCIAASAWLRDLMRDHYGAQASHFDLGVDHETYRPRPVERRDDTVIFYARETTPRRGVPLGVLVLDELHRRRPNVRLVLFGSERHVRAPFPYVDLGVASPEQLSWAYSEATIGLSLSLTNYSLIPQEMLACGLPVVELAGRSMEQVFGVDGPVELAPPDVMQLATALERLLDDPGLRDRRSTGGVDFVGARTWDAAADQLEIALRRVLKLREDGVDADCDSTSAESLPPPPPTTSAAAWRPNARSVPIAAHATLEATERLSAALTEADIAEVERRLEGNERDYWHSVDGLPRRSLAVTYGVWHEVPAVVEKTGLRPDMPPDHVHAMARGALAAGGAIYYADMLADALRRVGSSMDDVSCGLDFGCSSGRVVRALAAAWPHANWHGCDPNGDAIAWAQRHLPKIAFLRSPQDPPLPYEEAEFDFVCAISIWSHYGETAAIRWLSEMHRIVRPGGHFLLTTHGLHSIVHYAGTGERSPAQLEEIRHALYRRGFWFAPEFGEQGDWGVKHSEWGTAFFTPEWLGRHALPAWSLEDYAVGQNASNQDVYLLRRR
jgi:glycosyltransferase involved in cell wall biosynthesis/SAM-dependent methyltransferase